MASGWEVVTGKTKARRLGLSVPPTTSGEGRKVQARKE
jgi:hypothetical protein